MQQLLTEMEIALNSKLYFIALQAVLTIPDICGAIQSDNGKATSAKYCEWYDRYAKQRIGTFANAEDIYLFRCSLLHQGTTIPKPKSGQNVSHKRILFAAPYSEAIFIHDSLIMGALTIHIDTFCRGMIDAAKEWIADMQRENNANYNKNIEKAIRYYPKGIPPYIVGIDIIG